MKAIEKISQELLDNLKAPYIKNLSMGDADANSTDDPEQARNFAFNFGVGNFTLGTVQVKINSDKRYLEVQFGHDLLNKVEDQSPEVQQRIKKLWFRFLRKMRKFVGTCPNLTFYVNNETQDHLNKKDAEMYTVDELKEGKMSKLAGSTKSSYQRVGENRIIIRHVGPIDEEKMGSRTRNIKAIYIENAAGERFLVKENSLIGARILAHHMSAGGNLMDDFSNHLYTMIREMRDLKSFVLASRNRVFESDDANQMVEAATEYYRALRETVRSLTTGRGYARYLESFDPKIDETNIDAEALKEKFVIRTFNEKFEAALPHIAKAYQKKIQEQNALYGAAQNYIDGETKFGLTESDVELYKSMKFESGQALSKKVLEHIATLLQSTDSRLSEFAAQSAEKFSTITEAPESQTWLHQDLAMNLVKGFVAEMNNLNEKPLNPYAIGMAQAMKSTGDEPPLKKSTIKKAHHIADVINKEQGVAEADISGATMKMIQVGDIVMYIDQKAEVVAISKDRKRARITIEKGMGSVTQDVNISDLNQLGQGVAEGAPELLKKEMPTHRHAEKLLAQNGVSKDDPDYHHHLNNTIKHLRQFGNIDLINKSDEQGVAEGLPQILRKVVPGYAKREIDKKMDAQKFGRTDVDRDANYYRYKKIQDKLKEQGVAEGRMDEGAVDKLKELYQSLVSKVRTIPNFKQYYDAAKLKRQEVVDAIKTSKNAEELKQKIAAITGSAPVMEEFDPPPATASVTALAVGLFETWAAQVVGVYSQMAVGTGADIVGGLMYGVVGQVGCIGLALYYAIKANQLGKRNQDVAEGSVEEGVIDKVRAMNYDRLAKRSDKKVQTAFDKMQDFDFADPERFPHEKEFSDQMDKMGQRTKKANQLRTEQGVAEGLGSSSPTRVMKKYLPNDMWDPILSHSGKSKHDNADGSKTSNVWRLRNLTRSFQGQEFTDWKQAVEQELGNGYEVTSKWPTPSVRHIQMNDISSQQGVAEGYQLDEGAIETITALAKKIPGIGKYYQMAQQYKPQLIEILKTSKSGKEVKQKMEQLAAGQSATVAESGMMKQLGGLAVGGGSILSTMWMNAMGMIDGVLAHAAAGEVGGAVASGSILGLIPVTLMLFAAMLLFKGSKQSSDEKAQAFQAQRGQQGMAEGSSDISGLMAASHLNKSFIITAETAEGQTKKFRVKAQSERVAKEKFKKHHSMAKIVNIKDEGVAEGLDDKELYGLKVGDVVKARVDDQIVQGNVIDLFPETMEVELLLRGDMAGQTVTVDVRDTKYMDESGVAEERKETKNEKGEVTSWSDETPWHKAKPKKQPSGTAANLAGQALQQTKKMAHKEEPNMTESKATINDKMFTDTLAMLKKYSGI